MTTVANSDSLGSDAEAVPDLRLRYCPHCGHALVDCEAFGRLRRCCPACQEVIFREHKVAAALVVTDSDGRLLLVRRAVEPLRGLWSLPAGFVDYDETPGEAAVRECREETGLWVRPLGVLDVIAGREHPRGADIVIVYEGFIESGTLVAGDDAAEARFFAVSDLPALAFRATQRAVDRWRSRYEETTR